MEIENTGNKSKLRTALEWFWLVTVVSSFFGSDILSVQFPAIGVLYPFRVLVPVTAVLYLVWAICEKHNPWKGTGLLQRACYVLIGILLVYGAVSMLWAIDFVFSFRRLFNLCYDLCFFFLMLELCRDKKVFLNTIRASVIPLAILMILGVYEVFCGGVISSKYDKMQIFIFFDRAYQLPVVTSSNANDYLTTVFFVMGLVFLFWAGRDGKKEHDWLPVLMLPVCYFLIKSADSRLILVGFFIVLFGMLVYVLCTGKKRVRIIAGTAVLILFVIFGNHYYQIKPAVINKVNSIVHSLQAPDKEAAPPAKVEVKVPHRTNEFEKTPLKEQFVDINKDTGKAELSTTQSAGVRTHLLIHAFQCFTRSKTLGVGLGNTENLAKNEALHKTDGVWSIHCFVARMIGDFGLFFLIPLLVIALELIRKGVGKMIQGIKAKDKQVASFWWLYLMMLLMFPFVSTASADAQDIIAMWMFLAGVVLLPAMERQSAGASE